jgi:hypothetical protein
MATNDFNLNAYHMKTIITSILLLVTCYVVKAQNGLTRFPTILPSKPIDVRGQTGIAVDDTGRVWRTFSSFKIVSSAYKVDLGLLTFGSDSVWQRIRLDSVGGPNTTYLTSIKFIESALWIGSDRGLLWKKGSTWKIYNQHANNPDTVNNFAIRGSKIYLATQRGLKVFHKAGLGGYWQNYDTLNSSLPTNKIKNLDIDKQGNIWLATDTGVVRFDPNKDESKIFNTGNSEFETNEILSVSVLPNGEVWVGTNQLRNQEVESYKSLPGLFLLKGNSFVHLLNVVNLTDLDIMPSNYFSELFVIGNKITFPSICSLGSKYFFVWFEIENGKLRRCFFKNNSMQPYANIPFICWHNKSFYFTINYGNTFKYTPEDLIQDSSYYYLKSANDTVTDYHIKEVYNRLNINNLDAPISVRGDMFFMGYPNLQYLSVKSNSGKRISYSGGLWMGGISDGNLHVSAATYRQQGIDYIQGPLKIGSESTEPATRLQFARIWKVSDRELIDFKENFSKSTYQIPEPILTWPAHGDSSKGYEANLASFVDVNSNGLYEPSLGDYPKINGQQNLYWIFNDSTLHSESEGKPLGVEVQANAYGYVCDEINDNDTNRAINNTMFIKYRIVNRSNRTYTNFTAGYWIDNSLGNYTNDRVGSNPKESYLYWYNGDSLDGGLTGFGKELPACALVMLKGFKDDLGAPSLAQRMVSYRNDFSAYGNPSRAEHYYNYLQGKWKHGVPITYGGNGSGGSDSQDVWMYPGKNDLLNRAEWTEESGMVTAGDRRAILIAKNITLEPGEVQDLEFALVYSPSKTNQKEQILKQLDEDVMDIKRWYTQISFPSCSNLPLGVSNKNNLMVEPSFIVYPNPSTGVISIKTNQKLTELVLFDVTGKRLKELNAQESIDISMLPSGLYFFVARTELGIITRKFIKQ